MKTILVTLVGVVLFAPIASARHIHTSGAYVVPHNLRLSWGRAAIPRAYGETWSSRRINPDEVPSLSPGGAAVSGVFIIGLGS